MARTDFTERACSVARTLGLVGEQWSLLILRDAFLGVRRFDDFQQHLGIARNILSDRLGKLVDQGILSKRQYSERPVRHEYRLTSKGIDLFPVLFALQKWGDTWALGDDEPLRSVVHEQCGKVTHPVPSCSRCGGVLTPFNVTASPLPLDEIAHSPADPPS
jgi:DNA-binding HxlR family transcriptional regulator